MIAVVGGKGGCGKTTTTAALARAFAARGDRPVAVDADCDVPDLHHLLGGRRSPGLDALAAGAHARGVLQSDLAIPGVRLVAAGEADDGEVVDALARLDARGAPVLVDTPAGASEGVAGPLRAADAGVLVSSATTRSLSDAAKTAAMARAVGTPLLGVVVTRSDRSVDPEPLLECPTLAHAPPASDPLRSQAVRDAYASVASVITRRNV